MAIDFELTAGPFGDCTSRYKVKLNEPYTVSEFVKEVRHRCEYGTVYIGTNCLSYKDKCEYRYGDLGRKFVDERYLDKRVLSATAHGGWGCMDYYLTLEANDMTLKYIRKPIVVEAYKTDKEVLIPTLEGVMKADPGDYIITGIKGERYPCKPDVFEATYEPYDEKGE